MGFYVIFKAMNISSLNLKMYQIEAFYHAKPQKQLIPQAMVNATDYSAGKFCNRFSM